MILGCVQPSYLAWIPLFQRMQMSDVFVYLDDVEYSKNSYHNRNRIKAADGPLTLTVPVNYRHHSKARISDIPIAAHANWADKHLKSIRMHYAKAPFFDEVFTMVEEVLSERWIALGPLNIALIERFRRYLGIEVVCHASSALDVEGQGNEKLVYLCKALGATHFIVKPNSEDYHPSEFFLKHDIQFAEFSPATVVYEQSFGEFVGNLSILDYAMHVGPGRF